MPAFSAQYGRAGRRPGNWEVYRLKSSPAAFIDIVYAEDDESALAAAIEEHGNRSGRAIGLFLPVCSS
jgi:hypothetical protein